MDTEIARAVAHAANQMHRAAGVDDTLEVIVRSAAEALPTFDHIGVSTVEKDGQIVTRASTSALVLELDDLQYTLHEGPCVSSMDGDDVVPAPHIETDHRWPSYLPGALRMGLRSQLGVRLHLDDRGTIGGLNLYSTTSSEIAAGDVLVAAFFATHASLALGKARHVETLNDAVATRQLVGQAIGILMERYDIDDQAAQAFLWRGSSHTNTKVRDMAASLVAEVNTRRGAPPADGPDAAG
ncbi:GAF and ANTAR domain-containing protein [Nocardioides aurantiacus]|uniref:ANTAR domain-containing protein n=1 Tax=Nocardioides aurantiacus TaxID=86796 RepID=A0A3N2CTY0_9ACTN|nr:ANTAR domain-containing protein [Nocardioides aurantiacus]ROR90999.1 ANTAR domain-containing protein [Nocardioides aurantiacus]